jgi:hypothetical protein
LSLFDDQKERNIERRKRNKENSKSSEAASISASFSADHVRGVRMKEHPDWVQFSTPRSTTKWNYSRARECTS